MKTEISSGHKPHYRLHWVALAVILAPFAALGGRAVAPVGIHALSMRNCGDICVTHFGAVPNDGEDDTDAIQAAVDAALNLGGGTVRFPAGTYDVSSIDVAPGLTLEGTGAILKKLDMQSKWARTFTTQQYSHEGETDSAPLVFRGLVFDGNRLNQGPYQGWEMEHQHSIFLIATGPGRLVASVEDCHFRDGVADGVSVYTNVSASIRGCTATDVFRGGVTVTGGNSDVHISDFRAGGRVHPTGIDVEIDGPGYGGSHQVNITADNLLLEGDFDMGIRDGSTFLGNNIRSYPGPFNLYSKYSTVRISNSTFGIGPSSSSQNRIVYPHDVTFSHCSFIPERADSSVVPTAFDAMHVFFNISGDSVHTGQQLRFLDCDFALGENLVREDVVTAIVSGAAVQTGEDNRLIVRGGSIAEGYDRGIEIWQGGTLTVEGMHVDADTAFDVGGLEGFPLDVTLDGVTFGSNVLVPEYILTHAEVNTLTHRNIFLDESQNEIVTMYGITNNTYRGRRVIEGFEPPDDTPGLLGDVYRLKVPVIGDTYEWLCTGSHPTAATWRKFNFIAP